MPYKLAEQMWRVRQEGQPVVAAMGSQHSGAPPGSATASLRCLCQVTSPLHASVPHLRKKMSLLFSHLVPALCLQTGRFFGPG